ncbi:hypothetical protein FDECE_5713 [Fusarium decemcellulare]|nr:hypothetical protein FDECE_5713 [Fusarium decemcellulare]
MNAPERRRRRPAVSCSLCRRRKIRCNREMPCSNCVRSKNDACVFESHPPLLRSRGLEPGPDVGTAASEGPQDTFFPTPPDQVSSTGTASTLPSSSSISLVVPSTGLSNLPIQFSGPEVESLKDRIRQLEDQLSKASSRPTQSLVSTPASNIETTVSQLGGTFHIHCESRLFGQALPLPRSVSHKTRLFGQSHFFNTIVLIRDMVEMLEPYVEDSSSILSGLQKCKAIARLIKTQRAPPWPTCLTTQLPPKNVTDELVESYLRTTERIYRIIHIPTFRKRYEALWASSNDPDRDFLVQLKLVLALGSITYDETFTFRTSAVRWVYEAQTWMSEPEFKSRLGTQYLQTNILLLLAREAVAVGGETMYVGAGSLLRTAVSMGLHRDPARLSKRTRFVSEMRRRLWNTVLEISLQSSITSGGPPLISLQDFDTEPPGNFDDDQLIAEDPDSRPEHDFTEVCIARALRKTFPCRLRVVKHLNDLGSSGSYEETLRLDAELRASYKLLTQTLHNCQSIPGHSPSEFELCAVDFIMRRYLSALHFPFFGPSLHETCYAFSRKVSVETSFRIWCAAYPPSSEISTRPSSDTFASSRDEFSRLTVCGFGFFRTVAWQASLIIGVELKNQLQEEDSLSPAPLRSDLICALQDSKVWSLRCLEAGETNVKGYLGISLMNAQIQGLIRRLTTDELAESIIKAGEEAEKTCLSILEPMAAQTGTEDLEHSKEPSNAEFELRDDWDFMMSDGFFDSGDIDPMTWIL